MADAVWPTGLPQKFLREGFGETRTPNVISSGMEIGAPQTRARSTWKGLSYTGNMRITYQQKIIFENFYQFTTISGTQIFEFPDPYVSDAIIEVKFDGETPPSTALWGGEYFTLSMKFILQPYT